MTGLVQVMHPVSPWKQTRLRRTQFSQTVFKPQNLSFPFYKIFLPFLAFNPFSSNIEIKQKYCTNYGTEEALKRGPLKRPHYSASGYYYPSLKSLPKYTPIPIYIYIRQGSHQHIMLLLFCLVKLTLHGTLIILICNVLHSSVFPG